jgi:hypothetical protein
LLVLSPHFLGDYFARSIPIFGDMDWLSKVIPNSITPCPACFLREMPLVKGLIFNV